MEADEGQIEQILLNLYVNAADAMPGGGPLVLKTQNATHEELKDKPYEVKPGNYVLLTVTDAGTGIDKKTQERIFEPFFTTKEMGRGTGLGLASVYGIVKGHGGYIDVNSRKGRGTTFSIYLPTLLRRKAPRILVVDDDREIRQMLIEALTLDRQYLVEEAANGIEASIKLGTYRPDLLILDIFMPEMDGLEVCRIIKTEPELADMQVIITTGHPEHVKLDEVVQMGFTRIFSKPFDLWDLVKAVEGILS